MLFYFNEPGDPSDDGVEYLDVDAAIREAAEAALAMTREQRNIEQPFQLEVSTDQGPIASIVVQVQINRSS